MSVSRIAEILRHDFKSTANQLRQATRFLGTASQHYLDAANTLDRLGATVNDVDPKLLVAYHELVVEASDRDRHAVDNDACGQTLFGKGCADDAGPAAGKRWHGIEEMGDADKPAGDGTHHDLGRRFAVADRNTHASRSEPLQKAVRQPFGSERDERAAGAGEIGEPVEIAQVGSSDMVRAVNAPRPYRPRSAPPQWRLASAAANP
jgi:hypothetical protein